MKNFRDYTVEEITQALLAGDRGMLARAISMAESSRDDDRVKTQAVLEKILPHTGKSFRIGITGVPGAGKSTMIDSLGTLITEASHKAAVLTVDPSSPVSGGSILGDKTRMEKLSTNPDVFIRPSASWGAYGGLHHSIRESILLCEAAGFDIVILETVGVGQSETEVKYMTDIFLLILLSGAGDELQMIKKGVMEMADIIVVNKADGENAEAVHRYAAELSRMVPLYSGKSDNQWTVPVLQVSSHTDKGIDTLWKSILQYQEKITVAGLKDEKRREQNLYWMQDLLMNELEKDFYNTPEIEKILPELEKKVMEGSLPAYAAARKLLHIFKHKR